MLPIPLCSCFSHLLHLNTQGKPNALYHLQVCKHKFSFTPVYAKDAPSRLPWHELAVGLLKRAAAAVRVAHRVSVDISITYLLM